MLSKLILAINQPPNQPPVIDPTKGLQPGLPGASFGNGASGYNVGTVTPPNYVFDPDPSLIGSANTLNVYISAIVGSLTVIAGLSLLMYFIMGAFRWVTAGGDAKLLESSRGQILNALIGFVLVVIGWFFVRLIGQIMGIDIVNPIWYAVGTGGVLSPAK